MPYYSFFLLLFLSRSSIFHLSIQASGKGPSETAIDTFLSVGLPAMCNY